MPSATPFVLITWAVRHLIADLEHREQKPFAQAFLDRQLTEYFLYAAHLITCGVPHLEAYANIQKMVPVIWPDCAARLTCWVPVHPDSGDAQSRLSSACIAAPLTRCSRRVRVWLPISGHGATSSNLGKKRWRPCSGSSLFCIERLSEKGTGPSFFVVSPISWSAIKGPVPFSDSL